jgi:hypothetical protein
MQELSLTPTGEREREGKKGKERKKKKKKKARNKSDSARCPEFSMIDRCSLPTVDRVSGVPTTSKGA